MKKIILIICFFTISLLSRAQTDKVITIEITEPDALTLSVVSQNNPLAFGSTDGSITVQIDGSTAANDGSYIVEWRNSSNTLLTTTTAQVFGLGYRTTLNTIGGGTYTITVIDNAYASTDSSNNMGCTIEDSYTLTEPTELLVTISETNFIACNGETGSLTANPSGGAPFTSGDKYRYNWFEEGSTILLGSEVTLGSLGAGNYYVVIEDQNGNSTQSDVFELSEPELLIALLDSEYTTCGTGNDWTISTDVQGGTLPYTYSWNTGDNTANIVNVVAGNYLVIITDAHGCKIIKTYSIEVTQVLGVEGTVTQVNCTDACEGIIDLDITGGVAPYIINWNTGDTTTSINNLCTGEYTVSVIDQKGCELILEYTIEKPTPIIVDLGEDKTLCNGQSHELDITIDDVGATYQWVSDNGFTSNSSTVSLTEAGIYTATLNTGLGCIGTDIIEIIQSSARINSEFLITSQAFAEEDIILVNTSNPLSAEVEWILPDKATIIEENNETITLRFDMPGAYEITLRSFQGDCSQDYTKPVVVEETRELPDVGDADSPFIVDFTTYPNPTTGEFIVDVTLQKEATISLRLFSLISNLPVDDRQIHNQSEYEVNYNVSLSTGIYFLLLETAKGSEIRKIIIE